MIPEPLRYDPEWLDRIRAIQARDVPRVAALHAKGMGQTLWGRLGEPFLRALYAGLLYDPLFIGFVFLEDDEVRGFIAGTQDGRRMMRNVFRRTWTRLAGTVLKSLLVHPGLIFPVLATPFYFRKSDPAGAAPGTAESLFCYFEPHLRGTRVSGLINKVLFDELLSRGHGHVRITTEADNEGAVRQLTSWGFERRAAFRFYGKDMFLFLLDLEKSPRVQPVSRHGAKGEKGLG